MLSIIESILSKKKIPTKTLQEELYKVLYEYIEWAWDKDEFRRIFDYDGITLTINANNINMKSSKDTLMISGVRIADFCNDHGVKNIIINNKTGYPLNIYLNGSKKFNGVNIINKGKTVVTIDRVHEFKGGSLKGDIFICIDRVNIEKLDPFNFIDIPMYYPILVDVVKIDNIDIKDLLTQIEEVLPEGHVYEYELQKGYMKTQRLYVAKGIKPKDFRLKYRSSQIEYGVGRYYTFMGEVGSQGSLVYNIAKY